MPNPYPGGTRVRTYHDNGDIMKVMAVRTTIDIPEPLHALLRHRAEQSGSSIPSLIVSALEQIYQPSGSGQILTGPVVQGPGKLGSAFPVDENPHDAAFPY